MSWTRREEERYEIYRELTRYAQHWAQREAAQVELLEPVLPDRLFRVIYGTNLLGLFGEVARLSLEDVDQWLRLEDIVNHLKERLPEHRMKSIIAIRDRVTAKVVARTGHRGSIFPILPGEMDRAFREAKNRELVKIAREKAEVST